MNQDRWSPTFAEDNLKVMLAGLAAGKTLLISTALRATRIEQKHVLSWRKAGMELLKTQGNSLYMARGKHYDCVDGCRLELLD